MTLSVARAAADRHGEDALVLGDGTRWSWRELADRSLAVAEWLEERIATKAGCRPAIAFPADHFEGGVPVSLLSLLALWELGWTAVPLHRRWAEVEREAYRARLGVDTLLTGADLRALGLLEEPTRRPSTRQEEPEALAALVATSGSTGPPKAVALSRRAFAASAAASARRLAWEEGDRWLLSLPLAHVGGLSVVSRCLLARRCIVLAPTHAGFDPGTLLAWAERQRVTLLSLVPTMLRRALDEGIRPPASLRIVLLGGAAAPSSLLHQGLDAGWPLWLTYGLTEACSQVATGPAAEGPGAPLLDGFEARERGGVLEIRGPALFSGYRPEGPDQLPGQWFRTGDLARMEERDGRTLIRIEGRADDLIISGGENIQPREIEALLGEHPAIRDACVVGVPDPHWGQRVAAALVPVRPDQVPSPEELEVFLRERTAGFRVPREWRVLHDLPLTVSGKVDRAAILALF